MRRKVVMSFILTLLILAVSITGCDKPPNGNEQVTNGNVSGNVSEPVTSGDSSGTVAQPTEAPTPAPTEAEKVKITDTEAKSIGTETFDNGDFSMQIPKGWKVTTAGTGMFHTIRVQDPNRPLNQIFVLLKVECLLHCQEGKDAWAFAYSIGSSEALLFSKAPVLDPPSTENYFKVFSEYATFAEQNFIDYARFKFPRFDGFTVTERFASTSSFTSYSIGEETLRATFTENGKEGEGMFAASVVDFGVVPIMSGWPSGYYIPQADGGLYMAYNTMVITAEKNTFIEWESLLSQCLGTLQYSDNFVRATMQAGQEQLKMATEIARISSERHEIIMAAWEGRSIEQDISNQMDYDKSAGYERLYNTKTGETYRAKAGWYDINGGDLYQPITDNRMFAKPLSGYIE